MEDCTTFGVVLDNRAEIEKLSNEGLRQLIFEHGWLLIREAHYDAPDFEALAARLGEHVQYGFGKVLNMEARKDSEESQFSNAPMALHQDTILNAENNAQFLVFRCLETTESAGGETLLTNNRRLMKKLPADLLNILRSVEFSYRPLTASYYKLREDGADIRLAPLARHPETGEEIPYLALDDPDDDRRNYAASVVGYDTGASRSLMEQIDNELRAPDVLHAHKWQVGDMLIMDNYLVCHGRNASTNGSRRRLERIAIKARKVLVMPE